MKQNFNKTLDFKRKYDFKTHRNFKNSYIENFFLKIIEEIKQQ